MADRRGAADAGRAGPQVAGLGVAAGVLVLAGVVGWQAWTIPVSPVYAKVGPTVVPLVTALGLGVMGMLLWAAAWRGGWQAADERIAQIDRAALTWIAAGLALNVLLIGVAGFTIASTILFVCVARGFGSRAVLRDAAIGAAFALTACFGFAALLGLDIGSGVVERVLERLVERVAEELPGGARR
jgi:putative tricarboxylic transport membrane protein